MHEIKYNIATQRGPPRGWIKNNCSPRENQHYKCRNIRWKNSQIKEYRRLTHTNWDCKYHVAFIPKIQKKKIFEILHQHLGAIFRELTKHKEVEVVEGHVCQIIPPKYAVSNIVGYIIGKGAITMARKYGGRAINFTVAALGGSRFYRPLWGAHLISPRICRGSFNSPKKVNILSSLNQMNAIFDYTHHVPCLADY